MLPRDGKRIGERTRTESLAVKRANGGWRADRGMMDVHQQGVPTDEVADSSGADVGLRSLRTRRSADFVLHDPLEVMQSPFEIP